ncbi:hypothetical protein B0J14DRAFT_171807 [Halenospora varia]|nr:hypothetical protein B0J14DRAFT_171807 [Halenospora varia]
MYSPGTLLLSIEVGIGLCTLLAIQGVNGNDYRISSDFATFIRMYKQWGESRNQRLEANPQPLAGSQHSTNQVQRPVPQHLPPSRSRPQPYRQPPLRNPADFSTLLQALDDVKKRHDEIYAMAEQIKKYRSVFILKDPLFDNLI